MATSTLIIYEPIENFKENIPYWEKYVRFYERYWGGPTSPLGVWFGNEYNIYRQALAEHLGMDEDDISDCFFIKDDDDGYLIAPASNSNNVLSVENQIPVEWFIMFRESERKELHSHWGFNAIHYSATLSDAFSRLRYADDIITKAMEDQELKEQDIALKSRLELINRGIANMKKILKSYDMKGHVVMNYGDICSVIHPFTLKNEQSVKELEDFLSMLKNKEFSQADSFLKIFNEKWDEIRRKCTGDSDPGMIQ